MVTKLKPVRPILVILCHLTNLTFEGNIAVSHETIDHVYIELNS
jgi:hypothetical protein